MIDHNNLVHLDFKLPEEAFLRNIKWQDYITYIEDRPYGGTEQVGEFEIRIAYGPSIYDLTPTSQTNSSFWELTDGKNIYLTAYATISWKLLFGHKPNQDKITYTCNEFQKYLNGINLKKLYDAIIEIKKIKSSNEDWKLSFK